MTNDVLDTAEIREHAAAFAKRVYEPIAAELDVARQPISFEQRRELGDMGFLGIAHEERFGGSALGLPHALAAIEQFAKVCRPAAFQVFETNTGPAQHINRLATEEQKERWLPSIISGQTTMAVAMSEPDAGSAATDLKTSAKWTDDGWLVNGSKRWISNGGEADQYLVYTRLSDAPGSRGIGALLIEKTMEGVSFGTSEKLMGFRGIPSSDIYFDDVLVPHENLVVPSGDFKRLFSAFSIERLGNATMSLAIGQAALDRAVAYVQERIQFGKELIEFQAVQMTIADMLLQVEAARLLLERAAGNVAPGGLPNSLEVSLAKTTANEMAKRVTDLAMQVHGGNGYTEEYGIERLHRDAHGWAIAGGTPTMQRIRIVSELLGRRFDQRS